MYIPDPRVDGSYPTNSNYWAEDMRRLFPGKWLHITHATRTLWDVSRWRSIRFACYKLASIHSSLLDWNMGIKSWSIRRKPERTHVCKNYSGICLKFMLIYFLLLQKYILFYCYLYKILLCFYLNNVQIYKWDRRWKKKEFKCKIN